MEWSFTIKAEDSNELYDKLVVAAQYVKMFPYTFINSPVDDTVPIIQGLEASRVE